MLPVYEPSGYLPSFHSSNNDLLMASSGRQGCTVQLMARRGQTWNLTLLDFGEPSSEKVDPEKPSASGGGGGAGGGGGQQENIWCTRYAVVRENIGNIEKSSVVCGNSEAKTRERNFYLSSSNIITVDMNLDVRSTYMIAFKAVGCAIPESPNIVHIRQEGSSHVFFCNATGESWSLVCKDGHWQGHHKACGKGLLIVVSLGLVLGVVIGSSLLGLVVCYYRRRYKRAPTIQQMYTTPTYGSSQQKDQGSFYKTYDVEPGRLHQTTITADFGTKCATPADIYKYPYQSCRPSLPFLTNIADHNMTSPATPARIPRVCIDGDDVTSARSTGAVTQYGKTGSDTSSSSDHVYEIPS
ncbi:hypothetical protein LSH36_62g01069 [Paralvinella palmiformis]|uniref:CUB domain-containing protein n=1 Tax=Paralvinella palmiformis TaxID=53620 RepID=A0AAD9NBU0_9ANNE|nr:hypothetical protein LSH36_62g01069 [Paralvinella palmiformis]